MSLRYKHKTADHDVDADTASVVSPNSPSRRPKRTRISQACDQCRIEKEKCEGERPQCQSCVTAGRICTYVREQKKRGPRTGSVRVVERTLAWIFDVVPGAEESAAAMLASEQARHLLLDKTSEDRERLHQKWINCRVNMRIQRLLSGLDADDGSSGECNVTWQVRKQRHENSLDTATASRETLESCSKLQTSHGKWPPLNSQSQDSWTPQYSSCRSPETQPRPIAPPHINYLRMSSNLLRRQPPTLTLPPNYDRLLRIYYSYTHCWFPLADFSRIYNTAAQYPRDGLVIDPSSPVSEDHAELWGALSIASFQDNSAARIDEHRDMASPSSSPPEIYAIARSLIPNEDGTYGLGHIHALLLLTIINIGQSKNHRAYILVGMAIRLALTSNLLEVAVEDQQFFRKQYLIAGCFILETLVCTILGRVGHLKSSQLRSQLPFQAGLQEEYQSWAPYPAMGTRSGTGCAIYPPAQSYSAFAQLYRFFRFLDNAIEQPAQDPKHALMALAESVDYLYSSCNSIVPASPAMLDVPSTFLVHATFLTVTIFMKASRTTSQLFLLLELLETHVSAFGVASSSPLIVGYMNLVCSLRLFEFIGSAFNMRWDSAAAMFRAVWVVEDEESARGLSQGGEVTQSHSRSDTQQRQSDPRISTEVSPGAGPVHNSFQGSAMGRRPILRPDNQTPEFTQSDTGMQTVGTRPDLDAALAELAEIDPMDSMDAQNEFLVNLGFGPGVNLKDLLGADVDFAS